MDLVAYSSAAALSVNFAVSSTTPGSPRGSLPLFQSRWNVFLAERLLFATLRLLAKTSHGSDVSRGIDAMLNQVSVLIVEDEPLLISPQLSKKLEAK
jgi:hypothetical protein